jgi:hypothetical protein
MADLMTEMLSDMARQRLDGLNLPDRAIHPDYAGSSILNLPASICRWLGAGDFGGRPLAERYVNLLAQAGIQPGFRSVVLILMDALSLQRLQRWMADGTAPIWGQLADRGVLAPLTSLVPSTTSAALTSLWTGRSPAEHGIVGYELWLKEYGIVTNTIRHSPMSYTNDAGSLSKAGLTPEKFLPFRTLGSHLAACGVQSYAFQHVSILNSSLSRMLLNDVKTQAFNTSSDLWVNLRLHLESQSGARLYNWVYWSEVDTFSHYYGPDDERTVAEFAGFSQSFERLFLNRLSPAARRDTLLVLIADHGQIPTPIDPQYDLRNHPALTRDLHIFPTGEHRLAYFFVRPGRSQAVGEYLERTWPGKFRLVDPAQAVEKGLFGPGRPHLRLPDRLGDFIVLAEDSAYLWWGDKDNKMHGRHGGLSADEMIVPFLAVRL